MKRTPLKRYTRLEARTPLRARRQEVGGTHGSRSSKKSYVGPGTETESLVASQGQQGIDLPKYPKPSPRQKAATAGIKRSWMRKGARKSRHARREREWGRMAWLHSLRVCFVKRLFPSLVLSECEGEFQVMHLGPRKGYRAPDNQTQLGCRHHHEDIDQARDWFLTLVTSERAYTERTLYEHATEAWNALTPVERETWDRRAAEERAARRAAS